ncbi:hypothetical protein B0A50_01886 [Salinomyces thailandicus]|uniref:C3H1-type domain-containing protein n=1 Tax=Salinomyces thailandicus TaxID=706561 RepID=A0A4U0U9M9_9PEZI|nr:hypothetical protein B0A50_01886 [Salinomyces thailandica]
MTEQTELQARIAAVAGRINQHKQQQFAARGRWAPYDRGGGRLTYGGRQMHKNKTLVVGEQQAGFVASRGQNHQLMTKDTYNREQKSKQEVNEQHRATKRQKRNAEEQIRILRYTEEDRELEISGLRFRLVSNGSKLTRIHGEPDGPAETNKWLNSADGANDSQETPKRAEVANVVFHRTKRGNLVRASALARTPKQAPQCEHFTRHGSCPFGPHCRFAHDPNKVAICKDYQKSGHCPQGDYCDLSHEMTYHRVPACAFFLRGNCTNSACRYPHIHVSPAAPVCRAFAALGFCAKGPDCDKRHVVECPDYANHGKCANRENGRCTLPHPDRAAVLRKAAERQAKLLDDQDHSDLSSDAEERDDEEDIDSDMEIFVGEDGHSHELSQQDDFVKVS